jgi:hypothetical protein
MYIQHWGIFLFDMRTNKSMRRNIAEEKACYPDITKKEEQRSVRTWGISIGDNVGKERMENTFINTIVAIRVTRWDCEKMPQM